MNRLLLACCLAVLFLGACRPGADGHILGSEQVLATSPCADSIFLYTPAIVVMPSGRYVVAVDYGGPGTAALDGPKSPRSDLGPSRAVPNRTWAIIGPATRSACCFPTTRAGPGARRLRGCR